jgi:hypothetical protein
MAHPGPFSKIFMHFGYLLDAARDNRLWFDQAAQTGRGLPYLDQAMRVWVRSGGLEVVMMDADSASETNCVRQPFSTSDIGQKKATVLIDRINLFWGTRWRAEPSNFDHRTLDRINDSSLDLLIGCVDTTPLSVTGTAEELDAELSSTIVGFVGSHLQMKNTLEKARAEMDAASKAAQAEARAKSKMPTRIAPSKPAIIQAVATAKPAEPVKPAPQKPASFFDMQTLTTTPAAAPAEPEEDPGFAEIDDDEPIEEGEEVDDAA